MRDGSVARRAFEHAVDDLTFDLADGTVHVRHASSAPHPFRRIFGDSPSVAWGAMIVAVLVSLLLVRPMVMSVLSWHRTAALLEQRRAEVDDLEQRHTDLTDHIEYVRTDEFVVERARQYGLVMPGERAFVVREIVHPDTAGHNAVTRLRNATVDYQPPTLVEPRAANSDS